MDILLYIPLYGSSLSIHQLMGILFVSRFWLLWILLLWTFVYKFLHGHMFLLFYIYLEVKYMSLKGIFFIKKNSSDAIVYHVTYQILVLRTYIPPYAIGPKNILVKLPLLSLFSRCPKESRCPIKIKKEKKFKFKLYHPCLLWSPDTSHLSQLRFLTFLAFYPQLRNASYEYPFVYLFLIVSNYQSTYWNR